MRLITKACSPVLKSEKCMDLCEWIGQVSDELILGERVTDQPVSAAIIRLNREIQKFLAECQRITMALTYWKL